MGFSTRSQDTIEIWYQPASPRASAYSLSVRRDFSVSNQAPLLIIAGHKKVGWVRCSTVRRRASRHAELRPPEWRALTPVSRQPWGPDLRHARLYPVLLPRRHPDRRQHAVGPVGGAGLGAGFPCRAQGGDGAAFRFRIAACAGAIAGLQRRLSGAACRGGGLRAGLAAGPPDHPASGRRRPKKTTPRWPPALLAWRRKASTFSCCAVATARASRRAISLSACRIAMRPMSPSSMPILSLRPISCAAPCRRCWPTMGWPLSRRAGATITATSTG